MTTVDCGASAVSGFVLEKKSQLLLYDSELVAVGLVVDQYHQLTAGSNTSQDFLWLTPGDWILGIGIP